VFQDLLEAHVVGLDVADLVDVRFDLHVVLGGVEHLLGDRAGRDPVHRLPGGGASAAAPVARAELRGVGVVAVGGARRGDVRLVLARARVLVLDHHADRRPGGVAVLYAGVDDDLVGLAPGGCDHRLPRLAPVELRLDGLFVELDAGGHARDRHAHRLAVALAVRRHLEEPTEPVPVHTRPYGRGHIVVAIRATDRPGGSAPHRSVAPPRRDR